MYVGLLPPSTGVLGKCEVLVVKEAWKEQGCEVRWARAWGRARHFRAAHI